MNDKLICPFCQQELESVLQLAGAGGLVEEAYLLCSKCNIRGERKLWEALAATKKKLDIAVDALNYLRRTNPICYQMECIEKALEQIKDKEQQ